MNTHLLRNPDQRRLALISGSRWSHIRRAMRNVGRFIAAFLLVVVPAFAQDAGGTTVVVPQRTPYVEMLVVAALCSAAVFVVCRSSRRN